MVPVLILIVKPAPGLVSTFIGGGIGGIGLGFVSTFVCGGGIGGVVFSFVSIFVDGGVGLDGAEGVAIGIFLFAVVLDGTPLFAFVPVSGLIVLLIALVDLGFATVELPRGAFIKSLLVVGAIVVVFVSIFISKQLKSKNRQEFQCEF